MATTAAQVAALRAQTGAGMLDAKKALDEANGDVTRATEILREKGILKAAKRADKVTAEGVVVSYIHGGGRIGVLLEMNCETDFVAKTDQFKALATDIAMHVAAIAPQYLSRDEVDAAVLEKEKNFHREQLKTEGKPEAMIEKILEGKMGRFYSEICLLDQPFLKDEEKTVQQLLTTKTVEIGEKISVRRFTRFMVGEGIEKKKVDYAAEVAAQMGA
jgi:elongation factor Ts